MYIPHFKPQFIQNEATHYDEFERNSFRSNFRDTLSDEQIREKKEQSDRANQLTLYDIRGNSFVLVFIKLLIHL